jgi:hypothetical protein
MANTVLSGSRAAQAESLLGVILQVLDSKENLAKALKTFSVRRVEAEEAQHKARDLMKEAEAVTAAAIQRDIEVNKLLDAKAEKVKGNSDAVVALRAALVVDEAALATERAAFKVTCKVRDEGLSMRDDELKLRAAELVKQEAAVTQREAAAMAAQAKADALITENKARRERLLKAAEA